MFSRNKKSDPAQKPSAANGQAQAMTAIDAVAPPPNPQPAPQAAASAEMSRAIDQKKQTMVSENVPATIIQRDLVLKGMILTDGAVELHGVLDGDICAKSFKLGETGTIKGDIVAEEVDLAGSGQGRVTARRVRLGAGARYQGDILHQRLSIEDGAEFEGAVLRKTDENAWTEISKTFETPGVELTEEALKAVDALKSEFDKRNRP